ncbi:CHAD domain-containing protein [Ancylobacter sonchi]|uniref:CHAD domain-containing protein n=1 Tax=Ancylobacter sonchi TaxID=1937790 RepID=UPI001BD62C3A|nr:CHAD domain-containing protein [Ancylobacter sonchi]MBS7536023.1 CHAD domain-containing protein [Ancylobacter sonchi]
MCTHLDDDAVPSVSRPVTAASGLLAAAMQAAIRSAGMAVDHEDAATGVHDLRKAYKHLRGLLRLVRGAGRADARNLSTELRDAARRLSGARDTVVMAETLDRLVEKGRLSPEARRAAGAALVDDAGSGEAGFPPALRADMRALVDRCDHAVAEMAGQAGPRAVIAAVAADYRRVRRRGHSTDTADDEQLHELRKAVIAHRYQMEMLTPFWPPVGEVWVSELQRLRDRLGHHHDLAMLIEAVRAGGAAETGWRAEVLRGAQERQRKLVLHAMRLQARLFAERPRPFARRLRAYAKEEAAAG